MTTFKFVDQELQNLDPSQIFKEHSSFQGKVISIIGKQGTGKSTLLNKLFETQFPQLAPRTGPRSTTRGIDAAFLDDDKYLILDCEGLCAMDIRRSSSESWHAKMMAFILAISDIVIFNIQASALNHDDGFAPEIWRQAFSYQLSRHKPDTLLVIVARDFLPEASLEDTRTIATKNLENLCCGVAQRPPHPTDNDHLDQNANTRHAVAEGTHRPNWQKVVSDIRFVKMPSLVYVPTTSCLDYLSDLLKNSQQTPKSTEANRLSFISQAWKRANVDHRLLSLDQSTWEEDLRKIILDRKSPSFETQEGKPPPCHHSLTSNFFISCLDEFLKSCLDICFPVNEEKDVISKELTSMIHKVCETCVKEEWQKIVAEWFRKEVYDDSGSAQHNKLRGSDPQGAFQEIRTLLQNWTKPFLWESHEFGFPAASDIYEKLDKASSEASCPDPQTESDEETWMDTVINAAVTVAVVGTAVAFAPAIARIPPVASAIAYIKASPVAAYVWPAVAPVVTAKRTASALKVAATFL